MSGLVENHRESLLSYRNSKCRSQDCVDWFAKSEVMKGLQWMHAGPDRRTERAHEHGVGLVV